jgi:hypothetical protein
MVVGKRANEIVNSVSRSVALGLAEHFKFGFEMGDNAGIILPGFINKIRVKVTNEGKGFKVVA